MNAPGIQPSESAAEFLRRHILAQAEVIRRTEDGVRAGREGPLHDMRVAIRRLRTLLRAFRKPLAETRAAAVEEGYARLLKELGPARDTDVWMLFLKRHPVLRRGASARFLAAQKREKARRQQQVRERLESAENGALKGALARLIDEDLKPGTLRVQPNPAADLGRRALRKALKRIHRRARGLPRLSPEKMHRLRIACRKARYVAEFLSGAWDAPLDALARRFKAIQDVLGDVHDQDVYLAHLRTCRPRPPARMLRSIHLQRDRDRLRFEEDWARFVKPRYQRRLDRILSPRRSP
ncbi:MAG TPA: CHAD domain-containing protein [Kiritimatiellia bacterium]|nr:CHAD domain-containing protein [Kiritimatiellia bacterium]HRZ11609.1 CHAD domain-containing protein [Kiritimatiellia bacterium]HSA16840.1 CHAD domain-containing protein [Kiritimatiellia bacterium]